MTPSDYESGLDSVLLRLPYWRREKALSYRNARDRFLCAEAYLLLKGGMAELYGMDADPDFCFSPSGKPSLEGYPEIYFNLSHCSRCAACVIADHPVGVDVEDIQYDEALARMVFNREELDLVFASSDREVEFTRLWTMKESLLKMRGDGLTDDMKDVLRNCSTSFDVEICRERGYVLCSTV